MDIHYFHEFIEELEELDRSAQNQIKKKLKELFRVPFEHHEPLALKGPQFKGMYKLRIGDWRLIYKIINPDLHVITLGR